MKSLAILLLVTLLTRMAFAIDPPLERFEFGGREMAAPVKIVIYATDEAAAKRAADAAFARIRALTAAFSDFDASSEIRRLCERAAADDVVQVSEDLWRRLRRAAELSRASLGAFDITVGPVVRLWRQARKLGKLPDPERLAEARALVDYRLVELEPERRAVKIGRPGVRIDLGGIAAGYAADEALRAIREQGLDRALVDIGGDLALGAPPPGARGADDTA